MWPKTDSGALFPYDTLENAKFYSETLKQPQALSQTWLARSLANQDKQKDIMDNQGDAQLIDLQNI